MTASVFGKGEIMSSALSARILTHTVESVRQTPTDVEPFPHIIIRNFFPADVYDDLLNLLPSDDQYEPFSYGKHHSADGQSNRLRFRMDNAWLDRLSGAQRDFWYAVREALGAIQLKRAIYAKLSTGLAFRFELPESDVNKVPGYALPELFRELSSYRIAPHQDTRRKVVTMQISLPRDESQRELGTEFYRRSLNPLHMLREPRGFEVAKCTPFLPNTAYSFSVLNNISWKSWHGRSTLPCGCGARNSILNIWYLQPADANQNILAPAPARAAA
jgi:hypothetical protein